MQNVIHRCYVLDEQQENFLRDKRYKIDRMDCFMTLIDKTARVPTLVDISGHRQLELGQGQFLISDVELSSLWGVDRKTVSKLMKKMESLGMFTSTKVAEVCVYSMHILSAWIVDGSPVMNPFYHKPGQPGNNPVWQTPLPNRIIAKTEEKHPVEPIATADNVDSDKECGTLTETDHFPPSNHVSPDQSSASDCSQGLSITIPTGAEAKI